MLTWFRWGFLFLLILSFIIVLSVFLLLRQSLPMLDGEVKVSGLATVVFIDRDDQGIPLISGSNRQDIAFATGYLHAQDRFFQMDLNRRRSAGELSELLGEIALEHDQQQRKHRFRQVARQAVEQASPEQKNLLSTYALGVNQGINDLGQKPFEYFLLGVEPEQWNLEDTFLTIFSMYVDLNDNEVKLDNLKGFLSRVTSPVVIDFLSPLKTRWDSPMQQGFLPDVPTPGPELVNLRDKDASLYAHLNGVVLEDQVTGSNNWAVSGELTSHGGAIIQDDMHLHHRVPAIWYRASLTYPHPNNSQETVNVTGVTLPGTPFIVVGSNTHIAWGFTNTAGDWVDLVELEVIDGKYMTNDGLQPFDVWTETINVKGQGPVIVEYTSTHWGPVVDSVYDNTQYALRWTAHSPEATNTNLVNLELANTVKEGMAIANSSGIPPQNFTAGGREGNIGWTIAGQIPNRSGIDSTYPLPWQKADENWIGWLASENYPKVYNPGIQKIWTANARIVSGEDYDKMGNGGYALGPRQLQIRDALLDLSNADEQAMLDIALDHRALYMENWHRLILEALTPRALEGHLAREQFYDYVSNWSGNASVDDVGYRLVREYNDALKLKILSALGRYFLSLSPDVKDDIDDGFMQKLNHETEMVWRLLDERPMNWLSPEYASWDELLIETVDDVIADLGGLEKLARSTWGQRNTAEIRHPLSNAIPVFGSLMNMPAVALNGDVWMPRAQRASQGVSERMVVAPGHEKDAIFHMPGGQSGHPLSPFFRTGYMDWVNGQPSRFLPGEVKHTLMLKP